jgi:Family of unknown function (DUF6422)
MIKPSDKLNDDQRAALDRAAYVMIKARDEAESILRENGIEPPDNPFASPCQGTFSQHDHSSAPPHGDKECACPRYQGNGGACINTFLDPNGPGFGEGTPRRKCGHPPSLHFRMD